MSAVWKDVPSAPGYQVSDEGSVRSVDRHVEYVDGRRVFYLGKELSPNIVEERGQRRAYVDVGAAKSRAVHLLVAEAFHGPRPEGMFCCHNDGNSLDNCPQNLRWDTPASNSKDMRDHGNNHYLNIEKCPHGHEYTDFNLTKSHSKKGHRGCLACARARGYASVHPEKTYGHKELSDIYFELAKECGPERRLFGRYKEMIQNAGTYTETQRA